MARIGVFPMDNTHIFNIYCYKLAARIQAYMFFESFLTNWIWNYDEIDMVKFCFVFVLS